MADWWHERPIRLVQTNLREIDARRDPRAIVREVQAFGANAILFSVGGIVSFYPTRLQFQTPVPYLLEQNPLATTPLYRSGAAERGPMRDFVGGALDEARSVGLRFIARLDLSKCHKHVYESHPEWFFRRIDGRPQIYNGLYSTCVNGGYYQEYAFEIMQEILDRYPVDAFFFNMFGFKSWDYSGNYHGLCQCENCQRRFHDLFGHPLPQAEDLDNPIFLDYLHFQRLTSRELAQSIADFIHRQANVALVNYQVAVADIVRSESNSAVDRPLPMWQLSGSDNVKRVRGTYPHKPACNAAVYFEDIPYRFASVSPHLTALRLAQDLAHGGDIDLYVLGTLQQQDRSGLGAAREVFEFAAAHEDVYRGLSSVAKTCLIYPEQTFPYGKSTQAAYRGLFRILTENHIPFDSAHDTILEKEGHEFLSRCKLVILPGAACLSSRQVEVIDRFVHRGGCLIATGETALYDERGRARGEYGLRCLGVERVKTKRETMRSAYLRIHDVKATGHCGDLDLAFLDGPYLFAAIKDDATTSLTLIPPSTYGPPEKCFIDHVQSDLPGAVWYNYGEGRTVYFPWLIDSLYYRHSSPGHACLLVSALLSLCPGQQVITDANPQVEIALFTSQAGGYVLNLVNTSGHHGTAFFEPVPMVDLSIRARLPRRIQRASSLRLGKALPVSQEDEYVRITVERLDLFDTIRLT